MTNITSDDLLHHEEKFFINGDVFIMFHTGRRIFRKPPTFLGFHVYMDDGGQTPYVGFAYDKKNAITIATAYSEYSLCKPLSLEIFPWCIRKLTRKGRSHKSTLVDTPALCGKETRSFHDLTAPVSLEFDNICEECAWIYWTSHWMK